MGFFYGDIGTATSVSKNTLAEEKEKRREEHEMKKKEKNKRHWRLQGRRGCSRILSQESVRIAGGAGERNEAVFRVDETRNGSLNQ